MRTHYCLAACIFFLLSQIVFGEDLPTKKVLVAAPKQVPVEGIKLLTPLPKSVRNDNQSRLRRHHLETPIGSIPQSLPSIKAVPADEATNVKVTSAAASRVKVVLDRSLTSNETQNSTSTTSEPTVADRGAEVLITANWFAAFSQDGGQKFKYLNPYDLFPDSMYGRFCCDQIALYDASHDLVVWLLQYIQNDSANIVRLAVAQGDDIATLAWRYYDFSPQSVAEWKNEWFDYPDLSFSDDSLYITFNLFATENDKFRRSVIMRLPISKLVSYEGFWMDYYDTTELGSLRLTRGASDIMYLGAHVNRNTLRLYTWPEDSAVINSADVSVQPWSDYPRQAPAADGRPWLQRLDRRITAAWTMDGLLGFAWSASQDQNYRFPYVRVVLLDKITKKPIAEPNIWNKNYAYAYFAASPNRNQSIGLSFFYGGYPLYPSHGVGALIREGAKWKWDLMVASKGTHGPEDYDWGDYLSVQSRGDGSWSTVGYVLNSGGTPDDVQLHFIKFALKQ